MAGSYAIDNYQVIYGDGPLSFTVDGSDYRFVGRILCEAKGTNDQLQIGLVNDGEPLPASVTPPWGGAGDIGFIWIHLADLGTFIDLLRNEKPVIMTIGAPRDGGHNRISTQKEPVNQAEEVTRAS